MESETRRPNLSSAPLAKTFAAKLRIEFGTRSLPMSCGYSKHDINGIFLGVA